GRRLLARHGPVGMPGRSPALRRRLRRPGPARRDSEGDPAPFEPRPWDPSGRGPGGDALARARSRPPPDEWRRLPGAGRPELPPGAVAGGPGSLSSPAEAGVGDRGGFAAGDRAVHVEVERRQRLPL